MVVEWSEERGERGRRHWGRGEASGKEGTAQGRGTGESREGGRPVGKEEKVRKERVLRKRGNKIGE